jgi:hypothetical protein
VNICIPIYVGIATAYGAQVALEMTMIHGIESDLHTCKESEMNTLVAYEC